MTAEQGGETVELAALTKRYDSTVAVDSISLDVAEGEFLVLLGPSGCGKTTTLRMVAGLESITDGSVIIGGTDVSQTTPQNRDVAMVFQNYALYPHKTVRENIRFPLRKTDLSKADQTSRIESTADLLDIADLLDKEPAALSGGQRQRVAIARAIAREPSVLLMDEPLSNLDAKLRVRTRSELRDLQQRLGITTVYVTHDQEEAMSIADRIAIMNQGRIEQVGTPEEVYRNPNSTFIADFLGDPSMNIVSTAGENAPGTNDDGIIAGLAAAAPDRAAQVGVRPEDLYLVDGTGAFVGDNAPDAVSSVYECPLTVLEPIGRAYELTLETGAEQIVARARTVPDELRGRDRVRIAFDRDAVYAFDTDGRRLR
ncbi:ABC transporter ATP-binding protein [Halostella sp. JP-L12]|nr:ABC transporter ATP-binding protein [Halostella sp. JP-L12]